MREIFTPPDSPTCIAEGGEDFVERLDSAKLVIKAAHATLAVAAAISLVNSPGLNKPPYQENLLDQLRKVSVAIDEGGIAIPGNVAERVRSLLTGAGAGAKAEPAVASLDS